MLNGEDKESIDLLIDKIKRYRSMLSENKSGNLRNDDAFELYKRVAFCCHRFYSYTTEGWEGEAGLREKLVIKNSEEPKLLADTLLPWPGFNDSDAEQALKKLLLFSNFSVITLPMSLGFRSISYSGGGFPQDLDQEALLTCLKLNNKYASLTKNYQAVFLPENIHEYYESSSDNQTNDFRAPFKQTASTLSYVPYNAGSAKTLDVFHQINLPYFPDITIDDLIKIKLNETDAFPRFQFFLKKKIKELSAIESPNRITDITDEINYEVHRLNIEAEKLSKLKIMQGVSIGIFAVSLGSLFLNIPGIKETAGIIGTTTFYNLIN